MGSRLSGAEVLLRRDLSRQDPMKLERYKRSPSIGPRILFFSGGTALNPLASELKRFTHNSIHFVTPFDSGGSSAELRRCFDMPAVGDMRSRMMALADDTILGNPAVANLFAYRLSKTASEKMLRRELDLIFCGKSRLIKAIPEPMRSLITNYLGYFIEQVPEGFDFRGASIGNLILTGGYLNHDRSLDPIAYLFSELVSVRGVVRTITDEDSHLRVQLSTGERIVGQHLIAGKEVPPLNRKIKKIDLVSRSDPDSRAESRLRKQGRRLIQSAELIVYPPGSFYSSLSANLLPKGVGQAILKNPAPKVYVPNLGDDPEQFGMSLGEQVSRIIAMVKADKTQRSSSANPIDILLTDSRLQSDITGRILKDLDQLGIQVVDLDLQSENGTNLSYDPLKLAEALLSLT